MPALTVPLSSSWLWGGAVCARGRAGRAGRSPEAEHDLVVAQVGVVVDGQDGLGVDLVPGQEAIVQAVLLRADDLWGASDIHGAAGPTVGSGGWGCASCGGPGMGKAFQAQSIGSAQRQRFPSSPATHV